MANREYGGQPCFVYGGGANLPIHSRDELIEIHDNGTPMAFEESNFTRVLRQPIDSTILTQNAYVRPKSVELENSAPLLAVAYGLSFPHFPGEAYWDNGDYGRKRFDLVETPHPVNEGMFIYDVVEREWAENAT